MVAMQGSCMVLLAAACLAALCVGPVSAGDYRGKPRPEIPQEWTTLKQRPTPEMSNEDLPDFFNWCSTPGGDNFCTSNWNQHVPVYCGACWAHGTLSAINDRIKVSQIAFVPGCSQTPGPNAPATPGDAGSPGIGLLAECTDMKMFLIQHSSFHGLQEDEPHAPFVSIVQGSSCSDLFLTCEATSGMEHRF